ncbi:protoporphyrinogen oxidase, partial [Micrococcus sp. SIMBA_131]
DLLAPLSAEALDPDAGPALGECIALATLVVEAAGRDDAPRGTGVLVGAGTDVAAKALTHATAKWAWLREVVARPQED